MTPSVAVGSITTERQPSFDMHTILFSVGLVDALVADTDGFIISSKVESYPESNFSLTLRCCCQSSQVIGDASPDASKLMKREGVRSVPSFHYFLDGEKVDVVNGANAEAIEAAITKNAK